MKVVTFSAMDPLERCGTCGMEEMPQGFCDFGLDLSCILGLQHHPCCGHLSPAKEETGSETCPMTGRHWGSALCQAHPAGQNAFHFNRAKCMIVHLETEPCNALCSEGEL